VIDRILISHFSFRGARWLVAGYYLYRKEEKKISMQTNEQGKEGKARQGKAKTSKIGGIT
jgi:hypothetical protein